MKVKFKTDKFYPCYPIFIVSCYDSDGRIKLTTLSSSYTLGNTFVLGIAHIDSYLSKRMEQPCAFCVNFLSSKHLYAIEQAGMMSNNTQTKKTEKTGLTFGKSDVIEAPFIHEASLVIECEKLNNETQIVNGIKHVIAHICGYLCEDELLDANHFCYNKLDIPLLEADTRKNVYRQMTNKVTPAGIFFQKS